MHLCLCFRFQAGVYQPFLRAHAHIDAKRREPWLFGEETLGHLRTAIRTRYQLLPYIYTAFYMAHTTGFPVMAPMWSVFSEDKNVLALDDQWMFGDSILVRVATDMRTCGRANMLLFGATNAHCKSSRNINRVDGMFAQPSVWFANRLAALHRLNQ